MTATAILVPLGTRVPQVSPDAFVAPGVVLVGDVHIEAGASIWYGAVLRGDDISIRVGQRANVQDGAVIHGDAGFDVDIGDEVTIGHRAVVHGGRIGAGALVGMSATVLDGAVIGDGAMVGAGALVTARSQVEAGSLWLGAPAKPVRVLRESEREGIRAGVQLYADKAFRMLDAAR